MMLPSYFFRAAFPHGGEARDKFYNSLDKKIRNYNNSIKNKK
jgi:hypothetical protein